MMISQALWKHPLKIVTMAPITIHGALLEVVLA